MHLSEHNDLEPSLSLDDGKVAAADVDIAPDDFVFPDWLHVDPTPEEHLYPTTVEWEYGSRTFCERIPAHVLDFVEIIGVDATVVLLLRMGGSETYFAPRPQRRGMVAQLIGRRNAQALGRCLGGVNDHRRVPIGNVFLSRWLKSKGMTLGAIARTIRRTDTIVRHNLTPGRNKRRLGDGDDE